VLPAIAFARELFGKQLERTQDMALSCMVLSRSFRDMSHECLCFWISTTITVISLAFSNLNCSMRLKEQGSRKLAELNTREHEHCQDSSARWSCIITWQLRQSTSWSLEGKKMSQKCLPKTRVVLKVLRPTSSGTTQSSYSWLLSCSMRASRASTALNKSLAGVTDWKGMNTYSESGVSDKN